MKFIPLTFSEGVNEEYLIKEGDSLLAIAIDNDLDMSYLMKTNDIDNPNDIKSGQKLFLNKNISILDFGCGELTTSYYVFNQLKKKIVKFFFHQM